MSQEEYLMQLHSIYNSNLTNHYWYKWNPKSLQNQNQTTEKTRYTHLSLCKHITKATTLSQPNGHFKTLIHLLKNSRSSFWQILSQIKNSISSSSSSPSSCYHPPPPPPGRKNKQTNKPNKKKRITEFYCRCPAETNKKPHSIPTQNFHAAYSKNLFVRTASSTAAAAAAAGREKVPHRTRGLRRSFSLNMSSASRFSRSLAPIPPPSAENTQQKSKPALAYLLPLFALLVSSSLDLWSRRHPTPKSSSKKL